MLVGIRRQRPPPRRPFNEALSVSGNGSHTSSMVPASSPMAAASVSSPTGRPANLTIIVSRIFLSVVSRPKSVNLQQIQGVSRHLPADHSVVTNLRKIPHPPSTGGWPAGAFPRLLPGNLQMPRRRRSPRPEAPPSAPQWSGAPHRYKIPAGLPRQNDLAKER